MRVEPPLFSLGDVRDRVRPMIDLVILDCDGVLADTEPVAAAVFEEMAAELGVELTDAIRSELHSGGKFSIALAALEARLGGGRSLPSGFVPEFRARSFARFREMLRPIAGVAESLRMLGEMGRRTCVASNGPRVKVELIIEVCGLGGLVSDGVHSAYEAEIWKPDPAFFGWVAGRCGVVPERCAVVDDSTLGIEAGVAAGMHAVLYDAEGVLHPQLSEESRRRARVLREMGGLARLMREIEDGGKRPGPGGPTLM